MAWYTLDGLVCSENVGMELELIGSVGVGGRDSFAKGGWGVASDLVHPCASELREDSKLRGIGV